MIRFAQRAVRGSGAGVLMFGAAVLMCLSGCATIDSHQRVAGWPELKVVEHHVSHQEMRDRCDPYVAAWMSPEGCTLFFLDLGEAHIYVSKDFPSQPVLEHERLHAAGYDHAGSASMQGILKDWKAHSKRQVAAGPQAFGKPLASGIEIQ